MSADTAAINRKMPRLRQVIATYISEDIENADEFGLFYRQPLSWTLCKKSRKLDGFIKDKTRVSLVACCNSNGTEKYVDDH